jgi:hypothetical protein
MHTTGYLVVPLKSVLPADRTIIFYEKQWDGSVASTL